MKMANVSLSFTSGIAAMMKVVNIAKNLDL